MKDLLTRYEAVATPVSKGCNIGIQIDLETWGTEPGCAIRSIGASVWDNLEGVPVDIPPFYVNVDPISCHDAGLHFDDETVAWWAGQDADAQALLDVDPVSLTAALKLFRDWYHRVNVTCQLQDDAPVWGNGKEFDISILDACYSALGMSAPWPFWATADVRTVAQLGRMLGIDVKYKMPFAGTPHYALDDANHQGRYTAETISLIKQVFDKGIECLKAEAEQKANRLTDNCPNCDMRGVLDAALIQQGAANETL